MPASELVTQYDFFFMHMYALRSGFEWHGSDMLFITYKTNTLARIYKCALE